MVTETTICGVGEDLDSTSTSALEKLLFQFGRNGALSEVAEERARKIRGIIEARRKAGIGVARADEECCC